jgi:hypothetical protein
MGTMNQQGDRVYQPRGKFQNFAEYNQRHMSTQDFATWLDIQRQAGKRAQVDAFLKHETLTPIERKLEKFSRDVLKKVIGPAVQSAAEQLARIEKASVVRDRTGTLRQAIGSPKAKLYWQSLTAWAGAGPRRGYGRTISAQVNTRGIKLRRTSKKFTESHANLSTFANPVKYAHFLVTGRKASVAAPGKALRDSFSGRFFGHSVKEAQPRNFMAAAANNAQSAANMAACTMQIALNQMVSEGEE